MPNPHLPRETLDHIVDFLHDKPEALKDCCLVSKSWVPHTRKRLFAKVEFTSVKDLESWKEAFPDPSNSPGRHTRTLTVRCARVITAEGTGAEDLVQIFPRVVRLTLTTFKNNTLLVTGILDVVDFTPFRKLSPTLKSLHVDFIVLPCSQILKFVSSLPFLEDLVLAGRNLLLETHEPQGVVNSSPQAFTGLLELNISIGIGGATRWLLVLPGNLHFRKLAVSWFPEEDVLWTMQLVTRCSDTLECLDIRSHLPCVLILIPRGVATYLRLQANITCPPLTSQKRQNW